MSGGLVALLDDVAALARIAAASVDDVAAGAAKAGAKAAFAEVKTAPRPALNSGSSSSAITDAVTASSAGAPCRNRVSPA